MNSKTEPKKMGRPRKEIDEAQFKKLCNILCTEEEIAGFFDCSVDTIERWAKRTYGVTFAEIYKRFSATGKISLRRYQFELAKKNAGMAIFLGKNYLGQRDHYEIPDDQVEVADDGFIDAIKATKEEVWNGEEDTPGV
jgi:hypothetical protein